MRTLIFVIIFALSCLSIQLCHAASNSEDATKAIPVTTKPIVFLAEIDNSIRMAKAGEYGRLTPGRIARMSSARNKISTLLAGHESGAELNYEDRAEVYNQLQIVMYALRSSDKDRIVCKRVAAIGTRLAQTECMTIRQREARARLARENIETIHRNVCVPGEGNNCPSYGD